LEKSIKRGRRRRRRNLAPNTIGYKCAREDTKYAEQLRCHAREGNSKTTDVGIRENGV
jgi:hypothetical protein